MMQLELKENWSLPTASNSLDKKLHDSGHRFSFFLSNAAFLSENSKWWMQNGNFPGPYESGVEITPGIISMHISISGARTSTRPYPRDRFGNLERMKLTQ